MILYTNDFTQRTILPNDCSVRKRTKYIENKKKFWDEQNQCFFERLKNERNGSSTNDERTKWKKTKRANFLAGDSRLLL